MVQILILLLALSATAIGQTLPWVNQAHSAANVVSLFASGSCSGYLKSDGSCDSGGGIPSGMVAFLLTETCPAGWTEQALGGDYLLLTVAANGDVGSTGGSTSYTPSGTNGTASFTPAGSNGTAAFTPSGTIAWPGGVPAIAAGTFTQPVIAAGTFTQPTIAAGTFTQPTIAWPTPVPTFTGTSNQTTSSTSGGTPAGTNAATATSGNCAATNIAAGTGSTTACKATAPNLTVPAETFSGSSLAGHTHTLTPAGTVAWPTGGSSVPVASAGAFSEGAISGGAFSEGAISGGAFIEGAITWPAGVPAFSGSGGTVPGETFTGTPGTVPAEAFSGTPATIQPTYVKVIACSKN
jgi:hypothetical protein